MSLLNERSVMAAVEEAIDKINRESQFLGPVEAIDAAVNEMTSRIRFDAESQVIREMVANHIRQNSAQPKLCCRFLCELLTQAMLLLGEIKQGEQS